jgi:DNA-binding NarL/FixJ family response regulator
VPIRVLLADDHPLVCAGLAALLAQQGDMEVVATAIDGREALRAARELSPDVVIMDVSMPGMNGIEAAERIRDLGGGAKVVMLSMHDSAEHVYRALRAGATGYLLKESAGREVVDAVRAVLAGRRYLSDRIPGQEALLGRLAAKASGSPLERLSKREREILQLVVEGKSSAEIAALVSLSPKTVETYRSRMMQKLGIADLPALVKFALQHGLTGFHRGP